MKKTRKLIDLDPEIVEILDREAQNQNRSLKSLLEKTIIDEALKVQEPSEAYKAMMDDMLDRYERGQLEFTPVEEVLKRYDL